MHVAFRVKTGAHGHEIGSDVQYVCDDLRRAAGNVTSLSEVPDAIARQIVGSSPEGHPDPVALLLLRSSGDERAEQIRVGFLRTFGERLALAAGWQPDGPDAGQLMLRAQLVLSISIGIALLRSSPGMEPLASAGEQDLVLPLRDLVNALLSPPKDE